MSTRDHPFWDGIILEDVLNKKYTPEFVPENSLSIEEKWKKIFSVS